MNYQRGLVVDQLATEDGLTDYERGRERLREVHGEAALQTVEGLGELGRLVIETAYGKVYSRPALTLRERQVVAVASLTGLGRTAQLNQHLKSSLRAGLSKSDLQEVIMETAIIAGFPVAMSAWAQLEKAYSEHVLNEAYERATHSDSRA